MSRIHRFISLRPGPRTWLSAALAGLSLAAVAMPAARMDFTRVTSAVAMHMQMQVPDLPMDQHEPADQPLELAQLADLDPIVRLMPLDLARVTSQFGHRSDPFQRKRAFHGGIDFGAPQGTPVYAVADGKVILAGVRADYGKVVVVEHGDGHRTLYAHASELLVRAGQKVGAGDTIAKVGSTGRSTGAHLHFEVHRSGKRIDPAPYLAGL